MEVTEKKENKKEISPIEQWDQVAFKLIEQILAPNGYKQIKNGSWRGLRIANAAQPGIVKSKVTQAQKITAQMVRTFRGQAQRAVQEELKSRMKLFEECKAKHNSIPFWRFKEKKKWYGLANAHSGYVDAYQEVLGILLKMEIK